MSTDMKFILVDDDDFTNILHDIIIKDTLGEEADIETFSKPEEGLEFIKKNYAESSGRTVLFLDINMPRINGWEFLEQYEEFSEAIKKQINIYILSSSLDHRDMRRAEENKNVRGFISKPLTTETILAITEKEFIL
jgi:two-component SAPR family response regulator